MTIERKDIAHLMALARLNVTKQEEERLAEQLPKILDYVGQLQRVETKGIEETSRVTDLANVTVDDVPRESAIEDDLLKQAPNVENALVKVKTIIA